MKAFIPAITALKMRASVGALAAIVFAAALSAPASAAITFATSGYVTSDPGIPARDVLIDDFSGPNPLAPSPGVTASFYSSGTGNCTPTGSLSACADTVGVSTSQGGSNAGGVAPAGDDKKSYLAVGANAADDVSFAVLNVAGLGKLSNISFYWGSADNYNFAQLLDSSGNVVAGSFVSGSTLGAPVNVYGFGGDSFRFTYNFAPSDGVSAIEFGEGYGSSFELTDVAVSSVPEPSMWVLMLVGVALTGCMLRLGRRHGKSVAAA